ncbi:MAG: outer membrane lipoprotein carrier protein LolA [Caldiserica bacterium]|nr:outer membrane lipoprotein carrier protein LolA [Caldisericota bacterium]
MRRNRGFLVVILSLFLVSFSLMGAELDKLISSLQEKGYSIQSYRADLSSEGKVEGSVLKVSGNIIFREGKGLKLTGDIDWGKRGKSTQTVLVTPAEFIIYNSLIKRGTRIDLDKIKAKMGKSFDAINPMVRFDLRNPFVLLGIDRKSLKLEGEGEVDGRKAYIFSAVFRSNPALGMKSKPYSGKLWVDKATGILLKMSIVEKGKEIYQITYTNIQINADIPDQEFTFSPPAGAKMVDITKAWLKR